MTVCSASPFLSRCPFVSQSQNTSVSKLFREEVRSTSGTIFNVASSSSLPCRSVRAAAGCHCPWGCDNLTTPWNTTLWNTTPRNTTPWNTTTGTQPPEHNPLEHNPLEHSPSEHIPLEHNPLEHNPLVSNPARIVGIHECPCDNTEKGTCRGNECTNFVTALNAGGVEYSRPSAIEECSVSCMHGDYSTHVSFFHRCFFSQARGLHAESVYSKDVGLNSYVQILVSKVSKQR
jgi:hypothetical protein